MKSQFGFFNFLIFCEFFAKYFRLKLIFFVPGSLGFVAAKVVEGVDRNVEAVDDHNINDEYLLEATNATDFQGMSIIHCCRRIFLQLTMLTFYSSPKRCARRPHNCYKSRSCIQFFSTWQRDLRKHPRPCVQRSFRFCLQLAVQHFCSNSKRWPHGNALSTRTV